MEHKIVEVVRLLCSNMKLERDKGVVELERILPILNFSERHDFAKISMNLISDSQNSWEVKHGFLLGAKSLIPYLNPDDDFDCNFFLSVKNIARKLLTDTEVRVRLVAGEVLGSLCQKLGTEVYLEFKDFVLRLIQSNLERSFPEDDSSKLEQFEMGKLVEKLVGGSNSEKRSSDAVQIFQDTAGWKNLETSMKTLQSMVEGCGVNFQAFIDEELLSLIFKTLTHNNRCIRETGFHVCSSLVSCGNTSNDSEFTESVSAVNPIFVFGHELCKYLANGLADDWPQVRLSASIAARNFLLSIPNNDSRQLFYPQLLPRMCLNRYYAADGVRIYNQETWRQVTGSAGKELVEQYIEPTVEYYIQATLSDNHAVREAACACIAELASKISKEFVRSYVNILLNTLLDCFQDESWAVRDAACLACGNFVLCFPNESKAALKFLFPMFYGNLSGPIPSMRQGAASALASVVKAYGESASENVLTHIRQSLENIKNQEPELEKNLDFDCSFARYSFIKRLKEDDSEKRINSCSSLFSSPGKEGCLRESKPWESADGCVYLIGEMSHIKEVHQEIISLFPLLKEAARYRHYANHVVFHETICKQIPVLAKNLGKKAFKSVIEEFFDIIFYSLECENALTSSAASQCLNFMTTFLGPNILRGKVNNFNPEYGKYLESVIHIAPY